MEDNHNKLCDYCHENIGTMLIWELITDPPVQKTICEQCNKDLGNPSPQRVATDNPTSNIT